MSMFSDAEQREYVSKEHFKNRVPALRSELLMAQQALKDTKTPVVLLFAGVDGAGKHEMANLLNEWMDPRWLVTRVYGQSSDEEQERPHNWRYWRDLPPRGQVGVFLSAWYSDPLLSFAHHKIDEQDLESQLVQINEFETMLQRDGALVIKFWMHLNKKDQKKHLQNLQKDPLTAWQVKPQDWVHWALYKRFMRGAAKIVEHTHHWNIVDGRDERTRNLQVGETLLAALHSRTQGQPNPVADDGAIALKQNSTSVLASLNMSKKLTKADAAVRIKAAQSELNQLQRQLIEQNRSMLCVFEGWDAAGKGGAIRRLVKGMDARRYKITPIAAPTDEEFAQHYLWRFWRHIPRDGNVTIFDRSWYGRVLVERVEGFASQPQWSRSYAEIREFEQELTEHGIILCKFWVHITPEEQLKRFKDREQTDYKKWKLTDEDWRNRDKWPEYEVAVNDLVQLTSTETAPWTLVEGNDKQWARVKILETVCEQLRTQLAPRVDA